MATMRLPPDFKELWRLLNEHEVQYLLIGGYAVGYHGYPRATADMDIWIARERRNAETIVTVLKRFGLDVPGLSMELFLEEKRITRLGLSPFGLQLTLK
jgi:hypothetical protein